MHAYTVHAIEGISRIMDAIHAESPESAKAQFRQLRPLARHIRVREYHRCPAPSFTPSAAATKCSTSR